MFCKHKYTHTHIQQEHTIHTHMHTDVHREKTHTTFHQHHILLFFVIKFSFHSIIQNTHTRAHRKNRESKAIQRAPFSVLERQRRAIPYMIVKTLFCEREWNETKNGGEKHARKVKHKVNKTYNKRRSKEKGNKTKRRNEKKKNRVREQTKQSKTKQSTLKQILSNSVS